MCLNIGTPKNPYFAFWTNGILLDLGVPILKLNNLYGIQYALRLQTISLLFFLFHGSNITINSNLSSCSLLWVLSPPRGRSTGVTKVPGLFHHIIVYKK